MIQKLKIAAIAGATGERIFRRRPAKLQLHTLTRHESQRLGTGCLYVKDYQIIS